MDQRQRNCRLVTRALSGKITKRHWLKQGETEGVLACIDRENENVQSWNKALYRSLAGHGTLVRTALLDPEGQSERMKTECGVLQ